MLHHDESRLSISIKVAPGSDMQHLAASGDKINSDAGTPDDYQAYLVRGNDVGGINVGFLIRSSRISLSV